MDLIRCLLMTYTVPPSPQVAGAMYHFAMSAVQNIYNLSSTTI